MKKKNDILYRPWSELKRLQDKKLHHFITRCLYPFSPYYRRLFDQHKIKPDKIRTVRDLQRIPFTSKNDFLVEKDQPNKNLEFVLQPNQELIKRYLPKKELIKFSIENLVNGKDAVHKRMQREYKPIFLTATAGTTTQPISFLYTDYDIKNLHIYGKRIIEVFHIQQNERAVNVFPYAPHLAFWQTVFAGFAADIFILSTGGGKVLGTQGNIEALLKVKPQFLIGVASYVYHILKTAHEQNLKLEFLNSIALGASRVPKGFKRKIAGLLLDMGSTRAKIVGTYGFTEARCAWAECPTDIDESSGYHTYPDKDIFEVIDPETKEVKGEGEDGELVYTGIDARGSCVLRYRTGDLVKGGIVYSPCPYCSRGVPRISSDIVRASNIKNMNLSKIKGTLVNLNNLEHALDDREEIDQWQIEISKKDNDPYEVDVLTLYLSLFKNVDKEKLKLELNREIFSKNDISFNAINCVSRDEILHRLEIDSAVKAKKVLDKRPKP